MKKSTLMLAGLTLCLAIVAPALAQKKGKVGKIKATDAKLGQAPVRLKQTEFEDGTGSIGLAPGWEITGVYKGAVQCTGPNGAGLALKLPFAMVRPGSSLESLPSANQLTIAQPDDLAGALREVLRVRFSSQLTSLRAKRIEDVQPGTPAFLASYEFKDKEGKPYAALAYIAPLTNGGASEDLWQLYTSAVVAPKAVFSKMLPTMLRMWNSWRPNGQKPKKGSTSEMWEKVIADRQKAFEEIQKEWRELL